MDEQLRPRVVCKPPEPIHDGGSSALALLPALCFSGKKIVFKKPGRSLISKVVNLSLLEERIRAQEVAGDDDDGKIPLLTVRRLDRDPKRFLKRIHKEDLLALKSAKNMPHPFVVRVFQLLAAFKGSRAEKWSEIQESIKLPVFKAELWKLGHRRIDPSRLQFLSKRLLEFAESNSEDMRMLCPLAVALLDWMRWVLRKAAHDEKMLGTRYGILLCQSHIDVGLQQPGRNCVKRQNLTLDMRQSRSALRCARRYVARLRSRECVTDSNVPAGRGLRRNIESAATGGGAGETNSCCY